MKRKIKIVSALLCILMLTFVVLPIGVEAKAVQYSDGFDSVTKDIKYIEYSRRVESTMSFEGGMCSYEGYGCGPIAGAEILGYWDSYYTDLLPNYTPTAIYGGQIFFKTRDDYSRALVKTMYTKMKAVDGGTNSTNFKNGMTEFANERGYRTTFTSSMNNYIIFKTFNYHKYVSFIQRGIPVLVCAKPFHMGNMAQLNSNTDIYAYFYYSGSHAMVGYGYKTIEYYRNEPVLEWSPVWYNPFRFVQSSIEVNFHTEQLLLVELGNGASGMINIDYQVDIFDAFAVEIHR